ncbi:YihY/virulence factor BrkB family protein [Gephyromycinifex aptenodytis]|uniref:YihY/virulence factor BrkB family protein n=1 Tax=Gephyromycinifex aptenodytis TaxID=2716227 RepID=UPI001B2FFE39|nr:YihY/virulence factor BrkB family protein [Gephyromycinifex aptenodytis]
MPVIQWLDRVQRKHPALGAPLAVLYKFFDDQGVYLAAIIAFYAFISMFPMFLLLSTILGFALESDPGLREAILASAASQIPVIGHDIEAQKLTGSGTAAIVAVLTALYGSLGVAQAIQNAMNFTWGVRRNERPNPFTSRLRSLGLIGILGLFVLATTLLSQLSSALRATNFPLTDRSAMLASVGSLLLSSFFFVLICRLGTAKALTTREVLPGSLLAGLAWQGLQTGGGAFVQSVVARSSATNGVFAVVLGLLAWLFLASIVLVICLEVNVVMARKLYPRSLLTPMTDLVDLTDADRHTYSRLARAQAIKGFQNVEVTFEHDGQYATAHRNRELHGATSIEAVELEEAAQGPETDEPPTAATPVLARNDPDSARLRR